MVQALRELRQYEEALNGATLVTPAGLKRDNHKAGAAPGVLACLRMWLLAEGRARPGGVLA